MKITVTEKAVSVLSPFHDEFVKGANQIGGKWVKPTWVFPAENEPLVRALCLRVYGTDGAPEPVETLRVTLSQLRMDNRLLIGPIEVLQKWNRDEAPHVGAGCAVVQGSLKSRGGSRNNPSITHSDDCVIRVKDVPTSLAHRLVAEDPAAYQIEAPEPVVLPLSEEEQAVVTFLKSLAPDRLALLLGKV